jgi:DinB superfamily
MDREAALADFELARSAWEAAFAKVPDGALGYLKPEDDYALGGLLVHVNWVLTHYRRVLDGIVAGRFGKLGPQDAPGEGQAAVQKAKAGLVAGQRAKALDEMGRLHTAVVTAVTRLPEGDWLRKADVIYGEGQDPYPTSPEDIIGWLRDHYREHVEQSADLIEDWKASR